MFQRMQVADMRVKLEAAKRIRLGMILIATTPSSVLHSYGSSQTDVGAASWHLAVFSEGCSESILDSSKHPDNELRTCSMHFPRQVTHDTERANHLYDYPGRWSTLKELGVGIIPAIKFIDEQFSHHVTNKLEYWQPHFETLKTAIMRVVQQRGKLFVGFINLLILNPTSVVMLGILLIISISS